MWVILSYTRDTDGNAFVNTVKFSLVPHGGATRNNSVDIRWYGGPYNSQQAGSLVESGLSGNIVYTRSVSWGPLIAGTTITSSRRDGSIARATASQLLAVR